MGWLSRLFHRGEHEAPAARPTEPAQEAPSGPFRMPVEDVFHISGRGTVVTGEVGSGSVRVGDTVRIRREVTDGAATVVVTGIEKFRATLEVATAGELVGLLLGDLPRGQVERGDVLEGS